MLRTLLACFCLVSICTPSGAAIVTLRPNDILGNTIPLAPGAEIFFNGEIALSPLVRDASGVPQLVEFSGNDTFIGIAGGNNNAFNDPDRVVGNAGDQLLQADFLATSGLTQLTWNFSRASGDAASGLFISGFASDPMATLSSPNGAVASFDELTGTLRVNIPTFNGTVTTLNLDPFASAGQGLLFSVHDTDQAGAQLALRSLSYDNNVVAVPEPGSFALMAFAGGGLIAWRRRRGQASAIVQL